MTSEEGERAGVKNHRLHVRIDLDKQNLSPPSEVVTWFKLENCALANGDDVGVAVPWRWPDPFDGITADDLLQVQKALDGKAARFDQRATYWAGNIVADVLGFDLSDKMAKNTVKVMLKRWTDNGALRVVKAPCHDRKERPIIEVGKWVDEA